ncbi:virulence factor Mce family protein [Mycolicibacterium sp. XJ1819]
MTRRTARIGLMSLLVAVLVGGSLIALRNAALADRVHATAYFANSNGIYAGDEIRILGIPVGKIDSIEPQQQRVKIDFWYDRKYQVPADVNAVIISPSLVSVRAIQLTPAYTGGPTLRRNAVIPLERTAVPVEWDDLRNQLQKLTETLQPTRPGGVSTLGAFINTAADNLRGEGPDIRETLIKLSQAFSTLGDHSDDLFSTVKNISVLVSALQDSKDVLRRLNVNLANTTALLVNQSDEIGNALKGINGAVDDLTAFIATNRESLGTTSDKLAAVTGTLNQSLDDIKQALHMFPTGIANFQNVYQPAQGALTGVPVLNQFANPLAAICSAVQAASRLGAEQSAKLCVQYLAPIFKNRQYNFPPVGWHPFAGAMARPNEITYSEDWMRPDYVPPQSESPVPLDNATAPPLPAEAAPPAATPAPTFGGPANTPSNLQELIMPTEVGR